MVCPRCARPQIECSEVSTRCAVCGMPYDPKVEPTVPSQKETAAVPALLSPTSALRAV